MSEICSCQSRFSVKSCGGVVAVSLVLFCLRTFLNVCGGTVKLLKYNKQWLNLALDMVGATGSNPVPPAIFPQMHAPASFHSLSQLESQ